MKIRIEIDREAPEEIVIRSRSADARLQKIQEAVARILDADKELALQSGEEEIYVPYDELLFFETVDKRVWAHTAKGCFTCLMHLNELERMLPCTFARASKSCVINTSLIRSISRYPTGIAKATFRGSEKTVYISRMFYKDVREIIEETRLK